MVVYKCDKCSKIFLDKQDHTRHMNRKTSCIKEVLTSFLIKTQESSKNPQISSEKNIEMNNKILYCNYCNKTYSRSDNLKRHEQYYCKIKQKNDSLQQDENIKLKLELDEQKRLIDKLIKKKTTINNNNTNNGTINNIVMKFGDDCDIKRFLTEIEKMQIMSKGGLAPNQAFKMLFYNPNKPQLHNAYATDSKLNKMMVYDGNKFTLTNYKEALQTMIDNSIYCVDQIYDEIDEQQVDMHKYKYVKNLLDKLNNNQNKKEQEETMKLIRDELKNEPYNCRELILKTHNETRVITI